jgi:hypothetical protein
VSDERDTRDQGDSYLLCGGQGSKGCGMYVIVGGACGDVDQTAGVLGALLQERFGSRRGARQRAHVRSSHRERVRSPDQLARRGQQ